MITTHEQTKQSAGASAPSGLSIVLPFAGFYNSIHDYVLDRTLESYFGDESGEGIPALVQRAFDAIRWGFVHRQYARAYCEAFAWEFGLSLTFDDMTSPRAYNFETDRVFAFIAPESVAKIYADTPREDLDAMAGQWFTSRDGFISSYSPDVSDWGDVAEWDHNQLGCLLLAYVNATHPHEWGPHDEIDLMESAQCNGEFERWMEDSCVDGTLSRLNRIHARLRKWRDY